MTLMFINIVDLPKEVLRIFKNFNFNAKQIFLSMYVYFLCVATHVFILLTLIKNQSYLNN